MKFRPNDLTEFQCMTRLMKREKAALAQIDKRVEQPTRTPARARRSG